MYFICNFESMKSGGSLHAMPLILHENTSFKPIKMKLPTTRHSNCAESSGRRRGCFDTTPSNDDNTHEHHHSFLYLQGNQRSAITPRHSDHRSTTCSQWRFLVEICMTWGSYQLLSSD
mmetsp:Transcript_10586/g.11422  ORF Transcript_10586/g.11422 Transcript_10586/m.11422 type:complete len:118 (+) Transcript_10586:697-1050(+)